MGHYKTAAYNEALTLLHTQMLNIGLLSGVALDRWKKTLSLMLEKDKEQPKLHRLRIIQLFEADLNFLLALIFGQRLTQFAHDHCGLNKSQYGLMRGHQCQSAVLNKVLTYDILRITKEEAASAEFGALACFDRIIPALVVLACRRLGLGKQAGEMFLDSLTNLQHQVKTSHGISKPFTTTQENRHFRTG